MRPFRRLRPRFAVPLRLAFFLPVALAFLASANSAVLLSYNQPAAAALLLIPDTLLIAISLGIAGAELLIGLDVGRGRHRVHEARHGRRLRQGRPAQLHPGVRRPRRRGGHELREIGVAVAIDDFGPGYSSLSYLQTLPIDTLKIDQSFVNAVGRSAKADAILTAMIDLGNALDLDVVAEGIETAAQAAFVRDAGCWAAQGYWYASPLTIAELRRLLHGGPKAQVA